MGFVGLSRISIYFCIICKYFHYMYTLRLFLSEHNRRMRRTCCCIILTTLSPTKWYKCGEQFFELGRSLFFEAFLHFFLTEEQNHDLSVYAAEYYFRYIVIRRIGNVFSYFFA